MKGSYPLLGQVSNELGILQGEQEKTEIWETRVAFSAAGRVALASLWDKEEDGSPISIVHFKRRAEREMMAFQSLYPEIAHVLTDSMDDVTDYIYGTYRESGFIYHSPNRIEICTDNRSTVDGIEFIRGSALNEFVNMSGLGLFKRNKGVEGEANINSLFEMFHLYNGPFANYFINLCKRAKWEHISAYEGEFLRTKPPFRTGYWTNTPDKTGTVSMLRMGQKGRELYYLYKWDNGQLFGSPLPAWRVDNYEYRNISTGLLQNAGTLPAIHYSEDGTLVHVSLGYLLPPAELNFLRLYSWPLKMRSLPSDFNRTVQKNIFAIMKKRFEAEGFVFERGGINV